MENNQKSRRVKKFQKRHDTEHFFFLFPDLAGSKLLCISLLVKNSNKYKPFEDRGMKVNLQTGWYLIKWAYNLQVETVMD